ncbi:Periplasmic binding protein [Seminavis robusta]|uniref:Periplasmic binding protein n=1 Tax=Seminavis robusta TaxID=568900 RepID=A0A9N8EH22_9STRA|nr:Periplasmic binding protein [Seminavis robusta]|eukprot:Sro1069_g237650.1 Periplasmic binding protein (389) ;mRNA; r:32040-33206
MATTTNDENGQFSKGSAPYPRVVSLLPSITELVASLDAAEHIVGITHECDYPPAVMDRKPQVVTSSDISPYSMTQEEIHEAVCGSLKKGHSLYGLNADVLKQAQPDIIFTQQLCDVCAVSYPVVLETCASLVGGPGGKGNQDADSPSSSISFNPKIISMEPSNLADVFTTVRVAGNAMGPAFLERAETQVTKWQSDLDRIQETVQQLAPDSHPRVAFLEWHAPIFCGGHWIADMMKVAGAQYDMCASGARSVAWKDQDLSTLDPDYILIGPCGFSLQQSVADTRRLLYGEEEKNSNTCNDGNDDEEDTEKKQKQEQRTIWWKSLRAVKNGNVFCLDGNSYYARPGPRLIQGAGIIAACIHGPEVAQALGEKLAPSKGYQKMGTLHVQE